jgi:glutathione synthase/RimK-type ligase-like ATP-grasp enzyme
MGRIANVTATKLPQPDPDEALFLGEVRGRGHEVLVAAWDDPSADWTSFDLLVLRSTWNYVHHVDAFRAWLQREDVRARVINPAPFVLWNLDKRYLAELASRGVPIVETVWVDHSLATPSRELLVPFEDVVIKPIVSAGSFATARFSLGSAAEREAAVKFLDAQRAERAMMIQPYQRTIETYGERSLVFVGGRLTHVMRKSPRFLSGPIQITGPFSASEAERALAAQVLDAAAASVRLAASKLAYARVDVIPTDDAAEGGGAPRLMELEITEPYLMLDRCPEALTAMGAAVHAWAATGIDMV